MTNWDDRRFFLAVAREGSLNKAAGKLGVNRSTVLRRITAFEEELSVRLFERLPNGYFLTSAGEEIMQAAERMEDVILQADRSLMGRDTKLSGKIRISLSGALATYVLMPDLVSFHQEHPEINLEILTTFDMPDLSRREADVAIRISNDPPEDLVGRRITRVAKAVYGDSHHVLDAKKGALSRLNWIGWSLNTANPQWLDDSPYPDVEIKTVITDPYATLKAVQMGLGMSVLPCFMGDQEPGLFRMPPGGTLTQSDLWVLTHKDLRNTARIQVLTRFISEAILSHRDLLEGKCSR